MRCEVRGSDEVDATSENRRAVLLSSTCHSAGHSTLVGSRSQARPASAHPVLLASPRSPSPSPLSSSSTSLSVVILQPSSCLVRLGREAYGTSRDSSLSCPSLVQRDTVPLLLLEPREREASTALVLHPMRRRQVREGGTAAWEYSYKRRGIEGKPRPRRRREGEREEGAQEAEASLVGREHARVRVRQLDDLVGELEVCAGRERRQRLRHEGERERESGRTDALAEVLAARVGAPASAPSFDTAKRGT